MQPLADAAARNDDALAPPAPAAPAARRHGRADRLWVAFLVVVLLLPLTVQLVKPAKPGQRTGIENRLLSPLPAFPRSGTDWLALPGRLTAYVDDHFGLRIDLLKGNNLLHYALFGETTTRQLMFGKDGRLFFTSHKADDSFSLIRGVCGAGMSPETVERTAEEAAGLIRRLIDHSRRVTPKTAFLLVPTAAALYPGELPDWLAAQCAGHTPPARRLAEIFAADAERSAAFVYPLSLMQGLRSPALAIPKTDFHWAGMGPEAVAAAIAEKRFGMKRLAIVGGHPKRSGSDVGRFNPGPALASLILDPDFAAAGITACLGPRCFPTLGHAADRGLSRFDRGDPAAEGGSRLLVVSDSFGEGIVPFFGEYFDHVLHLDTNPLGGLPPETTARLARFALSEFAPDAVVYVFHDLAMASKPAETLRELGWE